MKKGLQLTALASLLAVIYFFVITSFSSCKKGHRLDCFRSNGDDVTEVRVPGPFKKISVHDKIEVTIVQGNEYKVEVTAGKNMIQNVKTDIKGDTILYLENTSRCNFVRGYKRRVHVKITMPYVSWIGNYSVSSIKLDPAFKQDSLIFIRNENSGDTYVNGTFSVITTSSHGNGDIYITGKAKSLQVYMNGTNFLFAEDLTVSDYVFVSTLSIGDARINLTGVPVFQYYIWKAGNIYFKGNPGNITNLGEGEANGKGKLINY